MPRSFSVEKNIFESTNNVGKALELNKVLVNGKEKYDLRFWDNDDPLNGLSLDKSELKKLREALNEFLDEKDIEKKSNYPFAYENFENQTLFDENNLKIDFAGIFINGDEAWLEFILNNNTVNNSYNILIKNLFINSKRMITEDKIDISYPLGYDEQLEYPITLNYHGKEEIGFEIVIKDIDDGFIKRSILVSVKLDYLNGTIIVKTNDSVEIGFKTKLVYTETGRDIIKDHVLEETLTIIPVLSSAKVIKKIKVQTCWCQKCHAFYINASMFRNLKNQGIILCQVFNGQDFHKYKFGPENKTSKVELQLESMLHRCGYNVNAKDALSPRERQVILDGVIDSGIMSKTDVLNLLNSLISLNQNKEHMKDSIKKWSDDIIYLTKQTVLF